jgi:hypothetical protein
LNELAVALEGRIHFYTTGLATQDDWSDPDRRFRKKSKKASEKAKLRSVAHVGMTCCRDVKGTSRDDAERALLGCYAATGAAENGCLAEFCEMGVRASEISD